MQQLQQIGKQGVYVLLFVIVVMVVVLGKVVVLILIFNPTVLPENYKPHILVLLR